MVDIFRHKALAASLKVLDVAASKILDDFVAVAFIADPMLLEGRHKTTLAPAKPAQAEQPRLIEAEQFIQFGLGDVLGDVSFTFPAVHGVKTKLLLMDASIRFDRVKVAHFPDSG